MSHKCAIEDCWVHDGCTCVVGHMQVQSCPNFATGQHQGEIKRLNAEIAHLQTCNLEATKLMGAAIIERLKTVEVLKQALSVCLSITTSSDRLVDRDGEVGFWQTEDWCSWAKSEIAPMLESFIKTAESDVAHNDEFQRIQMNAKRYEKMRHMDVEQFRVLYMRNREECVPFDILVDRFVFMSDLKPLDDFATARKAAFDKAISQESNQ